MNLNPVLPVEKPEKPVFVAGTEKLVRVREVRKVAAPAELQLWSKLRDGRLDGLSFRRQHPMGKYILDFYCASLKLAVELSGGEHFEPAHLARDKVRIDWFTAKGIETLHIRNADVLENTSGAVETILQAALKRKKMTVTKTAEAAS